MAGHPQPQRVDRSLPHMRLTLSLSRKNVSGNQRPMDIQNRVFNIIPSSTFFLSDESNGLSAASRYIKIICFFMRHNLEYQLHSENERSQVNILPSCEHSAEIAGRNEFLQRLGSISRSAIYSRSCNQEHIMNAQMPIPHCASLCNPDCLLN